jgi:Domain of unknown function (DUF4266)
MRIQRWHLSVAAAAFFMGATASGCATVKPWDRDLLAKPAMKFVACPSLNGIDQHVYFSKEASTGGAGLAGGGCGCN